MPRRDVTAQRRKQLIDAYVELVGKRGMEGVSIADVCNKAGMSRGIVNFYFTTKEAMVLDAFRCVLERGKERGDFIPKEMAFLWQAFAFSQCNKKAAAVMQECGFKVGLNIVQESTL